MLHRCILPRSNPLTTQVTGHEPNLYQRALFQHMIVHMIVKSSADHEYDFIEFEFRAPAPKFETTDQEMKSDLKRAICGNF